MSLSFFNEGMYRETFFASLLFLTARFLSHLFFALNSFAKSQLFLIIFCWIFRFLNAWFFFLSRLCCLLSILLAHLSRFFHHFNGCACENGFSDFSTILIFNVFGICIIMYIHTIFLVNFMNMRQRFMFHMDTWISRTLISFFFSCTIIQFLWE